MGYYYSIIVMLIIGGFLWILPFIIKQLERYIAKLEDKNGGNND